MPKQAFSGLFYFRRLKTAFPNGKNLSSSKGEQETEVLFEDRSTLLPLRPKERLYARFRDLPHLLQGARQRRAYPRDQEVVVVNNY